MADTNLSRMMKYAFNAKEAYATLTDEEVDEVARRVREEEGIPRVEDEDDETKAAHKALVLATLSKINAQGFTTKTDALYAFQKEYESQIKLVTQPQGGTENFTNVRSPGMPPAKHVAEGEYSTFTQGTASGAPYGRRANPIDDPSNGWYDSRGTFHASNNSAQPYATTNPEEVDTRQQQPHLSHGPVGTAGDTSSIPTFQPTKPGNVRPEYSGVGPRTSIPAQSRPEGGVSKRVEFNRELLLKRARMLSQVNYAPQPAPGKMMKQAIQLMSKTGEQIEADEDAAFQSAALPAPPVTVTEEDEEGRRFDERMDEASRLESLARKMDEDAREQEMKGCYTCRDDLRRQSMLLREKAVTLRKTVRPNFGDWRR